MLNGLAELLLFCEAVVLSWFVKLLFVNCIQYSFSLVNKKKKKKMFTCRFKQALLISFTYILLNSGLQQISLYVWYSWMEYFYV